MFCPAQVLDMAAIVTTNFEAEVTWLGMVPADVPANSIRSQPCTRLDMDFGGPVGEYHHGATRPACVRVAMLYRKQTEIRNTRQLSILAQEELDAIALDIGLDRLDPALLGASIVLRGIPDFTRLPPSSRLQASSGLTLTVDMENRPCQWPAKEIETVHPGHGKLFKPAAEDRRGVTAWVECPGSLSVGDKMRLFVPGQRAWNPGD